jgi:acetyltransferase-like isoleucine patch superfamily enzyme
MTTLIRELRQRVGSFLHWLLLSQVIDRQIEGHLTSRWHVFGGNRSKVSIADSATVLNAFFNVSSGIVTVGEGVMFGNNVSILTGRHDPDKIGTARQAWPESGGDILIKDGAWVASHAVVLGPCVIGEYAVVAAGAVVTHDVPPFTLVGGVPARMIRKIRSQEDVLQSKN